MIVFIFIFIDTFAILMPYKLFCVVCCYLMLLCNGFFDDACVDALCRCVINVNRYLFKANDIIIIHPKVLTYLFCFQIKSGCILNVDARN